MRIHLIALGSYGDVLPFLAIGAECLRRGHDVILAAPAPFADHATRIGLPFHSLGDSDDYRRIVSDPRLWHPRQGAAALFGNMAAATEQTYRWIAENARKGRSIVVASTLAFGARVAQEKLRLPVITIHAMPMLMESRYASPILPGVPLPSWAPSRLRHWIGRGADRYVIGPAALPYINAFRQELGLNPVRRLRYWWNSPSRILLLFPDWFARAQPDWPQQAVHVGFPIADRFGDTDRLGLHLSRFLKAGDPPLVFTYGSAMRQATAFFRTALAICQRLGRRGVFLAPEQGQVPEILPETVIHVPYAPLSALLPHAAALIHHGGIGTVAQALAAGTPQMIVPVAFDHFDEAARVKHLRAGTSLSRRRFTPWRGARRLRRLLASPEVAQACQELRLRFNGQDGVSAACDAIEQMAPRRR
ncbi:nucleotide disphospho-sugar-binding domain-containing protein [Methylobacterium sp. WCS2018Hpa-22]|uniref:glycosyltransferase n=1 Tax=Methylobacterium sp. WCS2018Hpa-22 TaxID=3073633 RepID=UPI00288BA099|nr:nucleotide disphospho-sugar-binding domain-containing protein [Methylobacterium sp. WCS2018Hpa-22]